MLFIKLYLTICYLIACFLVIVMLKNWDIVCIDRSEFVKKNKYLIALIIILFSPIIIPLSLFIKDNA